MCALCIYDIRRSVCSLNDNKYPMLAPLVHYTWDNQIDSKNLTTPYVYGHLNKYCNKSGISIEIHYSLFVK